MRSVPFFEFRPQVRLSRDLPCEAAAVDPPAATLWPPGARPHDGGAARPGVLLHQPSGGAGRTAVFWVSVGVVFSFSFSSFLEWRRPRCCILGEREVATQSW